MLEELPQGEGGLEERVGRVQGEEGKVWSEEGKVQGEEERVGREAGRVEGEEGKVGREKEERWWSLVLRYRHFRLPRIETLLQHCIQLLGFYGTPLFHTHPHMHMHTCTPSHAHPHMHILTCTPSHAHCHRFTPCSSRPSVGGISKLRPPQEGAADINWPCPHRSWRKGVCSWEREGTKVTH